jgi:hypothetical protein
MLVTIIPSIQQMERHAQSALNGFEDLSRKNAIDYAKCEFENLLTYLNRLQNTDDAV